jgi:hypothetical protein
MPRSMRPRSRSGEISANVAALTANNDADPNGGGGGGAGAGQVISPYRAPSPPELLSPRVMSGVAVVAAAPSRGVVSPKAAPVAPERLTPTLIKGAGQPAQVARLTSTPRLPAPAAAVSPMLIQGSAAFQGVVDAAQVMGPWLLDDLVQPSVARLYSGVAPQPAPTPKQLVVRLLDVQDPVAPRTARGAGQAAQPPVILSVTLPPAPQPLQFAELVAGANLPPAGSTLLVGAFALPAQPSPALVLGANPPAAPPAGLALVPIAFAELPSVKPQTLKGFGLPAQVPVIVTGYLLATPPPGLPSLIAGVSPPVVPPAGKVLAPITLVEVTNPRGTVLAGFGQPAQVPSILVASLLPTQPRLPGALIAGANPLFVPSGTALEVALLPAQPLLSPKLVAGFGQAAQPPVIVAGYLIPTAPPSLPALIAGVSPPALPPTVLEPMLPPAPALAFPPFVVPGANPPIVPPAGRVLVPINLVDVTNPRGALLRGFGQPAQVAVVRSTILLPTFPILVPQLVAGFGQATVVLIYIPAADETDRFKLRYHPRKFKLMSIEGLFAAAEIQRGKRTDFDFDARGWLTGTGLLASFTLVQAASDPVTYEAPTIYGGKDVKVFASVPADATPGYYRVAVELVDDQGRTARQFFQMRVL